MTSENDDLITGILESIKTIAVIGASANTSRPSNGVMKFLLENGYSVYPVNPGLAGEELLGQKVYGKLGDVPSPCDMINIFRNSEEAGKVCDEAILLAPEKGIQVIWMQLGITNETAKAKAVDAGLITIQNRCVKIEHQRLMK
ncbi:MAG: CoA-binding protein [Rhodospirillaceae bacterium]|nr:CoA-binding protein [Rhodospirillaceae bacterium]